MTFKVPGYLTVVEVLAIHALLIDEFGGGDGLRDLGALESAVFRPQTGYYRDAIAEAAALLESLLQNHPFLDGNERTAVACADVHLRMNGFELGGDSDDHTTFIIELIEAHAVDLIAIEGWLRRNSEEHLRQERIGDELTTELTRGETDWLDSDPG